MGGEVIAEKGLDEEVELVTPVPVYPVSIKVITHPPEISHSFATTSHCCVRIAVVMDGKGILVQYRLEKQEKGARISGNTDGLTWLGKKDQTKIELGVTVSRPGFFHLKNLQFRAKAMESCDRSYFMTSSGEEFLPVDLVFTVANAG